MTLGVTEGEMAIPSQEAEANAPSHVGEHKWGDRRTPRLERERDSRPIHRKDATGQTPPERLVHRK